MGRGSKRRSDVRQKEESGVEVVMEKSGDGPWCPHGPMLLFARSRSRFYACSCSRRGECIPNIPAPVWSSPVARKLNLKYRYLNHREQQAWLNYQESIPSVHIYMQVSDEGKREVLYCMSCDIVCHVTCETTHASHDTLRICPARAQQPSTWLPPLYSNTKHAQYHFSQSSLDTIVKFLLCNNIKSVVCMGTPSLHEALRTRSVRSLLLDIDARYAHFSSPKNFLHYNMYNNHFFKSKDVHVFHHFLNTSRAQELCVVVDPPFGGRLEPLAGTLRSIATACSATVHNLNIVLVFPYFAEPHIINLLPQLYMHHYQVRYRNHKSLGVDAVRSPVRLFSTLSRASLCLDSEPHYRYCAQCVEWVGADVSHCDECGACVGRDGRAYVHCKRCERCVKPSYKHCETCRRCCLPSHTCGDLPTVQSCYHCEERGHKRVNCPHLSEDVTQKRKRKKK